MKPMHELMERWRVGQTVHVDGIVFKTGRVVLFEAKTICFENEVKCVASPFADTTLDSILTYDEEPWVELTSLFTVTWDRKFEVSSGEGAMGNEGFVALKEGHSRLYEWVLFCSSSNPFTHLERDGEHILAHAGYDQVWRIPLMKPESFTIL